MIIWSILGRGRRCVKSGSCRKTCGDKIYPHPAQRNSFEMTYQGVISTEKLNYIHFCWRNLITPANLQHPELFRSRGNVLFVNHNLQTHPNYNLLNLRSNSLLRDLAVFILSSGNLSINKKLGSIPALPGSESKTIFNSILGLSIFCLTK